MVFNQLRNTHTHTHTDLRKLYNLLKLSDYIMPDTRTRTHKIPQVRLRRKGKEENPTLYFSIQETQLVLH